MMALASGHRLDAVHVPASNAREATVLTALVAPQRRELGTSAISE
jgi:hypothetical protein